MAFKFAGRFKSLSVLWVEEDLRLAIKLLMFVNHGHSFIETRRIQVCFASRQALFILMGQIHFRLQEHSNHVYFVCLCFQL